LQQILLVGMGADEQFAGYSRHRTAFMQGSWQGLHDEVLTDIRRISTRNLGRDDRSDLMSVQQHNADLERCLSDHGKEARFPFLDEDVFSYLQSLPISVKADMRLPRGHGEKSVRMSNFVAI